MKIVALALVALMSVALTAGFTSAKEKAEEVTLKGTATCAKCDLKKTEKCQAALVVKDADGKEVVYYLKDNKEGKALHKEVCKEAKKDVSVTGIVSEKEGQKWITASKIDG